MADDSADGSPGGVEGKGHPGVGTIRVELEQAVLFFPDSRYPEACQPAIFMDQVDAGGLGVPAAAGESIRVLGMGEAAQQLAGEAHLVDQGSEGLDDVERAGAVVAAGVKGDAAHRLPRCARIVEDRDGDPAAGGDSLLVDLDNLPAGGIGNQQGVIDRIPGDPGGELECVEGRGDGVEQLFEVGAVFEDPVQSLLCWRCRRYSY